MIYSQKWPSFKKKTWSRVVFRGLLESKAH
jgi:hypothetical protein